MYAQCFRALLRKCVIETVIQSKAVSFTRKLAIMFLLFPQIWHRWRSVFVGPEAKFYVVHGTHLQHSGLLACVMNCSVRINSTYGHLRFRNTHISIILKQHKLMPRLFHRGHLRFVLPTSYNVLKRYKTKHSTSIIHLQLGSERSCFSTLYSYHNPNFNKYKVRVT